MNPIKKHYNNLFFELYYVLFVLLLFIFIQFISFYRYTNFIQLINTFHSITSDELKWSVIDWMNGKPWMKAINGMNDSRSERKWVIAAAMPFIHSVFNWFASSTISLITHRSDWSEMSCFRHEIYWLIDERNSISKWMVDYSCRYSFPFVN